MKWEEIPEGGFDETNPAHIQALTEHSQSKGSNAYTFGQKRGWPVPSPSKLEEDSTYVGTNITLERQFIQEKFHHEILGGTDDWWELVLQIAGWWREGYIQAQAEPKRFTVDVDGKQIEVEAAFAQNAACKAMLQILGMHSHAELVTVKDQDQSITYIDVRLDHPDMIHYIRTD